MADTNVRLVVTGKNESGRTFEEVQRDLNRVRAELAKPVQMGPLTLDEHKVRQALEGREKGLARQLESARLRDLVNARLGGGDNTPFLKSLKGGLGEESDFGGVFKILRGTGAVAGLGLAASLAKNFAESLRDAKNELVEGKISAGELVDRLARSVPVLGNIFSAGRAIREVFGGEDALSARLTAEAQRIHAVIDVSRAVDAAVKQSIAGLNQAGNELRVKLERISLAQPLVGQPNALRVKIFDIEQEGKDLRKSLEGRTAAALKALEPLRTQSRESEKLAREAEASIPEPVTGEFNEIINAKAIAEAQSLARSRRSEANRLARQLADETNPIIAEGERNLKLAAMLTGRETIGALFDAARAAVGDAAQLGENLGGVLLKGFNDRVKSQVEFNQNFKEALDSADLRSRLELLDRLAAAGDRNADVEAKRLRVAEEYNALERELLELRSDPRMTDEMRRQLDLRREQIQRDKKKALSAVGNAEQQDRGPHIVEPIHVRTDEFIDPRFSGFSLVPQWTTPPDDSAADTEQEEERKETNKLIEGLVKFLAEGGLGRLLAEAFAGGEALK